MPEIRFITFYIITSRKGDDMKQGVFWLIDNKLLAIPFDKSKYPDGIAKSGDTYNHEKLWKYVKPQNCNKPYNYYPRGRVVKGTKNKAIVYMNPDISNEFILGMFIMQKYLQNGELGLLDLQNFDSWIGMFAEKSTEFEIDVDTSSYRLATRFSKFHNLPELTTLFSQIADFHHMDEVNGIPAFDGYSDALIGKTLSFENYLDLISSRADVVRAGFVNRSVDNMLKITTDGRKAALDRGTLPMFAQRMLEKLKKPQTNWRTILNDFIQEEICDYSFSPPDRRFQDSPFFLPNFNEMGKNDNVSDILFFIDTSGSISDNDMTTAYSEIKGAIDQYDGKLQGWLGFFDAAIIEPKPFSSFEEFNVIKPAGGGGTDFQIIFEYVNQHMKEKEPNCIIILTDGYAQFPKEELANDIPVLWLINNQDVTPPWGKVARFTIRA